MQNQYYLTCTDSSSINGVRLCNLMRTINDSNNIPLYICSIEPFLDLSEFRHPPGLASRGCVDTIVLANRFTDRNLDDNVWPKFAYLLLPKSNNWDHAVDGAFNSDNFINLAWVELYPTEESADAQISRFDRR